MRDLRNTFLNNFRISSLRIRLEKKGRVEMILGPEFNFVVDDGCAPVEHGLGGTRTGRETDVLNILICALEMEVALDDHLDYEQDAEDFVAGALVGFCESAREDVAEAEDAFAELVVGAGEVEDCQAYGVDGGWRGDGIQMFEYVFLELIEFLGRLFAARGRGDAAAVFLFQGLF